MSNKSAHLSRAEIEDLTDRQLPSKQIAWLKENGWKFAISASGRPKVSRIFYDFKLGPGDDEALLNQEPDFSHWTVNKDGGTQKKQPGAGHVQAVRLRGQAA